MQTIFLLLLYLLLSLGMTFTYERWAIKAELVDKPNHRSSHHTPTPRGAGLVFVCLWALLFLCLPASEDWAFRLLPGFLLNGAVGFLDDHITLAATKKLMLQLLA